MQREEAEDNPEVRISKAYWEAEFELDELAPTSPPPEAERPKPGRFRRRKPNARPTPPPAEQAPASRRDWSMCDIAKVEWFILRNRLEVWTAPLWFH